MTELTTTEPVVEVKTEAAPLYKEPVVEPVKEPAVEPAVKAEAEGEGKPKSDAKGDEKVGAPEAYEAFTFPENVVVDEALMGEFTPLAKELGLTQDQAQKLVDMQTKELVKSAESQAEAWGKINQEWVDASKADKEIGGTQFPQNLAVAKKALDTFGTPELRDALEITGAGNHPEFLRFMYRVGKTLKDDAIHSGAPASAGVKDAAKILFPNQN